MPGPARFGLVLPPPSPLLTELSGHNCKPWRLVRKRFLLQCFYRFDTAQSMLTDKTQVHRLLKCSGRREYLGRNWTLANTRGVQIVTNYLSVHVQSFPVACLFHLRQVHQPPVAGLKPPSELQRKKRCTRDFG